jgi:putative redox protein
MSLTATARAIDGGAKQEVDVNGRHTIVTDEPRALGGTDAGPAPHELLPAMLAACVSTTLALHAERRGFRLDDLRVDVDYDPSTTPRRVELIVHLPDGLTTEQLERLQRLVAACPVRRALETGFAFNERLALDLPAAA